MSKYIDLVSLDLAEKIEEYIIKNGLKPNDALPSERHLASQWNVNRLTLREAIDRLVDEDRLYKVQGRGTFVAEPKFIDDAGEFISYTDGWISDGYTICSKQLHLRVIEANKTIAGHLNLNLGEKVYDLKRIRIIQDIPLTIETSYIPAKYCEGLEKHDFENHSLYSTLKKEFGIELVKQSQIFSITSLNKSESGYLGVSEGSPAFYIVGTSFNRENSPVEYSIALTRSDRYEICSVLTAENQ
ncbi:MAG TPA: GntR family transcriptional regulator [Clostridia bacterium]|nr:GntR family transcriptional regulator [Clostridia bacterium]